MLLPEIEACGANICGQRGGKTGICTSDLPGSEIPAEDFAIRAGKIARQEN
jgi:hypothetical protein